MRLPSLDENPRLRDATVFLLYVMQGVPAGFALTTIANRLAASGVAPPTIGRFTATVGLPWTLQFLWGPLIDRFQGSPMGRRKPWLLGTQLLALAASLGVLLVRDPAAQVGLLTAAFFTHSVFASAQDASADALAITVTPPDERARVNAFMRCGMLAGNAVGAAGLALVLRTFGFRAAAATMSLVLLVLTAGTFFLRERRDDALLPWARRRRARTVPEPGADGHAGAPDAAPDAAPTLTMRPLLARLFGGLLARESVRLGGAVLAVYFAASVFIRMYSTHLVQGLRWDDARLSVLTGTWGMGAAVVSIVAVGALGRRAGARRLLLGVTATIGAYLVLLAALAPLWPDAPFTRAALVLWYTCDPGFSVAAMPVLMALCREGVEGSQFTAYMALSNLMDVAGGYVAGHALTVLPAPAIALLCGLTVLAAVEAVRRSSLGRSGVAGAPAPPLAFGATA